MNDPGPYLIWSHEHGAWCTPGHGGYVRELSRAGRYSRADALTICANAIPGTARRLGALPELPVPLSLVLIITQPYQGALRPLEREAWE